MDYTDYADYEKAETRIRWSTLARIKNLCNPLIRLIRDSAIDSAIKKVTWMLTI